MTVSSQVIDLLAIVLFLLPQGKVFLEELNDGLSIAEIVLLKLINLIKSLLEGGVSELASLSVILKHLVVEHRVVEGEAELNGVAGGKIDG